MRISLVLLSLLFTSFKATQDIVINKEEAKKAFVLLNDIRTSPSKYYKDFPFLRSDKIINTRLKWNDTLVRVAEAKAYDMAKRNYFNHVNPDGYGLNYYIRKSGYKLDPAWTKNKAANFFESMAAEITDGEDAIKVLITDKGEPTLGHRKHLLGLDEWSASLYDIGIGYAEREEGSDYSSYVSIVIAKHN